MESFPTLTPTPPEALNCGDFSLMASCLDCFFLWNGERSSQKPSVSLFLNCEVCSHRCHCRRNFLTPLYLAAACVMNVHMVSGQHGPTHVRMTSSRSIDYGHSHDLWLQHGHGFRWQHRPWTFLWPSVVTQWPTDISTILATAQIMNIFIVPVATLAQTSTRPQVAAQTTDIHLAFMVTPPSVS